MSIKMEVVKKMNLSRIVLVLSIFVIFNLSMITQGIGKDDSKYVGTKSCKMCHMSKKSGAAFKIWQKTKHAQAYTVLASDAAKAIAKEKGIADPQKSADCLTCHVTAYGVAAARLGKKYQMADGVSCESCHGPGSKYKSQKTMKGIAAGDIDPSSVGLIKPDVKVCEKCHNKKSPTFKAFNFKERFAKIAHPRPK